MPGDSGLSGLSGLSAIFGGGIDYLLQDGFSVDVAAGGIDGTSPSPGPGGIRVSTDIGNNLSIGGGVLNVAGGTGVWGQTTLAWATGIVRPAGYDSGYVLEFDVVADVDKGIWVGLCTDTGPGSYLAADCEHGLLFASDGNLDVVAAGAIVKANAVALANGVTYRARFILYSSGCFYSISGGAFGTLGVTYTALHETISQVTATLYAAISNLDAVTTIDRVQTEATLYPVTFANYVTDVPYAEAYQLRLLFRLTAGNAWTTKTNWLSAVTAATWFGITVTGGRVTHIAESANNMVGNITAWAFNAFTALIQIHLGSNAVLLGSVASWVLPSSLTMFNISSSGIGGSIAAMIFPAGLVTFALDTSSITGSIASLVLPAGMMTFNVSSTSATGSMATLVIPASMIHFRVNNTTVSDSPVLTSAVSLQSFYCDGCALLQATVDLIVSRIYARRMSFTFATPVAHVGGTNAAPSGVYADEDPPITGKGFIFELVNDPEAEGFNKWTITYTP